MKVLYVIPGLGIGGGAERSLLDVAPGLGEAGIELSIAYFHERPTSAVESFRALDIPVRHIAALHLPGRVRALRAMIAADRPDIVHTTLYEADVAGRFAAWRKDAKVLSSLVNTNYEPARRLDPTYSFLRVEGVRVIEGFTLRHLTDRVHANSSAVRDSAVRRLKVDPRRITVVHRGRDQPAVGADADSRRSAARAALGVDHDTRLLVSVGRHEFQKGHLALVEALATVVVRHPTARLLVAGREGTMTPHLEAAIAERGLEGHVELLGHRDDVAELLCAADLFAFPSLLEGLPGAVIEAMALGVPIVASAIPPVTELVDHDQAVLVAPDDPRALAAALSLLLDDPAAARALGARARDRFLAEFTIERSRRGMVQLYRDMMDE